MKLMEQIKKDKETFNKIPTRDRKLAFIAEYYGVAILSVLLVIVLSISSVFKMLTQDEVILYTVLVNSDSLIVETDETVFETLFHEAGFPLERQRVDVNTDLYLGISQSEEDVRTLQVLSALFMVSDLDVYVSDEKNFKTFADEYAFANLSLLLDSSLIKQYEDDLYTVVSETGEEYVVGVYLRDSALHKAGYYHDEVVIGIANNAVNFDNSLTFLKQLLR